MIQFRQVQNTIEIDLPVELDAAFGEAMLAESKSWLVMPVTKFVFNFKGVLKIKTPVYRSFIIFAKLVKQGEKKIESVKMEARLIHQLKSDGIIQAFNPILPEETSKASFDVNLINPFIEAVTNTLKIQAQTPSHPGKPHLMRVEEKNYDPPIGIVGLITLSTAKLNGSIALIFTEAVFLKIYENMFGEKHTTITSEIQDAAAELLNISYGTAKTKINETLGYELQPAIPTVLSGEKMNLHQKTREKVIILPFESTAGTFQMEITIESK